jgi:D-alanyl-lipoteichoic acid acyltransferase DltB (MBOAT superfamily)
MLFNSYEFIFGFLPVTLAGFFLIGRWHPRSAAAFLAFASFVFYAWWDVRYVALLAASILANYAAGYATAHAHRLARPNVAKACTTLGVGFDLALLGYFKYAGFFVRNVDALAGIDWHIAAIVLPLGISFFTFTQIAFLVDVYQRKARDYNLVHYALFVTYFPHLIAGPILHHKEMMPQFAAPRTYVPRSIDFSVGLTIFAIGLFKKTVLADGIAEHASAPFALAAAGTSLDFFQAWGAALAYTLQLYFDFSGYSDMAIGLSRLFGVRLPLNFASPYKATSIVDFWRRWHMTLSRFLRDYLYFPLGGNRLGNVRRYTNLMVTMLLGGLWHGAGWTFVVWGGLHGIYLCVNHAWQHLRQRLGLRGGTRMSHLLAGATTFAAVVVGWVFFRAQDFPTALSILAGMAGAHGVTLPDAFAYRLPAVAAILKQVGVAFAPGGGTTFVSTYAWIGVLLPVVFLWPNTQEIMSRFRPALGAALTAIPRWQQWSPRAGWATIAGIVAAAGLLSLTRHSEFLYFQF